MKVSVEIDDCELKKMIEEAEVFHTGTLKDEVTFAEDCAQDLINRYWGIEHFDVDRDWVSDSVKKETV